MWALRVLGTLELATPAGTPLPSECAQPKRLALLTYLALARPRGAHTRDHLLGLLWPELDDSHARAALRQAVHHLRQGLGEQAIATSGHNELRLDSNAFGCDAICFEAELDANRPESALAFYRGDLLEGFFVTAAPGFEEWLERERTRLRARAANGAWAVAELRARDESVDEAASWGARALALSRDDEKVLQRLLRLLDQLGDRVRAVLEYDAFARRMLREYEMEPSLETRRIVEEIRTQIAKSPRARPASPIAPLRKPSDVIRPDCRPLAMYDAGIAAPSGSHPERTKRRLAVPGVAATVLVAAVIMAIVAGRRALLAAPSLDANLVTVAPFQTIGLPDSATWKDEVADIFRRKLDDAGSLRTAPARRWLRFWSGSPEADRAPAVSLARHMGAGLTLFGAISRAGVDSSSIAATLIDAATGAVISDQKMAGANAHMEQLVDSIAVALVLELSTRVGIARPAGSLGSRSLGAIKAFLRGDQAFRRAQWDSAQQSYQQAVLQDSTFALAIRQLGRLAAWRDQDIGVGMPRADSVLLVSSQRASRNARGLGARDSLLILSDSLIGALAPDLCADSGARKRLLDVTGRLTLQFPADPEGWVARGDAFYVCGGYFVRNELGIDKRAMLQAYDRAIVLDSSLALAYDRAFRLALDLGDTARVRRYASKYLSLNPSDVSASYLRALTALLARPADAATILDTLSGDRAYAMFVSFLMYPDSAELAVTAARRLGSTTAHGGTWDVFRGIERTVSTTTSRHRPLALEQAYRGHLRASTLVGTDRTTFAGRLPADIAIAADLAGARGLSHAAADSAFRDWLHAHPFTFDETMASVLPWFGVQRDTLALKAYLQLAPASRKQESMDVRIARYAHHLAVAKAYLALARTDTTSAIEILASLPINEWWVTERLVLARLYVARRRTREAFGLLDRGIPYPYPTPLSGFWAIEHARLATGLGLRDKARESYDYVARLWCAADPELQRYVLEARAELAKH